MTISDVVFALGSADFEASAVLLKASQLNDTSKVKELSLKILAYEKTYADMLKALNAPAKRIQSLTSEDYRSLRLMNSAIISFTIRDMSKDQNVAELKSFFVGINAGYGADISRIREDVKAFMQGNKLSFRQQVVKEVMRKELSVNDIIPVFMQVPDALLFIPDDERGRFIFDIEQRRNNVSISRTVDMFYDCVKRDALSSFAKYKDADLTLSEFIAGIKEITRYVKIDVEKYVERAATDLVTFEEVIT